MRGRMGPLRSRTWPSWSYSVTSDSNYTGKYRFDREVFQKFIAVMFVNYATTHPMFYGTSREDYGVSSDKDMMQLVHDGRVMMRDPMTDRPIGEAEVREKFGVGPDKVIEVQALCGDSTDNVPGVPGIGVKTAAELIAAYGDLETLLARADEIKQPKRRQALIDNEAKARLSKELVKLDDDVPLPCPLSALRVKPYDPEKLFPFLDEMELRALKSRIERAKQMLLQGDRPVCEIAAVLGFCDQSHLTRTFRRLTGVTPREFARLHSASD